MNDYTVPKPSRTRSILLNNKNTINVLKLKDINFVDEIYFLALVEFSPLPILLSYLDHKGPACSLRESVVDIKI